jgi:superfamily II DNA or RNA helicase
MSGIYKNIQCDNKEILDVTHLEHQTDVKNKFINHKEKGLILYHQLGSGKTCTSYIIADEMLDRNLIEHVYIFSPGSLRQSWFTEYCDKCGFDKTRFTNKFTFITYNYHVGKHLPKTFSNTLVIIDEFHNLINSVKNFSKNAVEIYNKLINSDCKILLLSGTPIYNSIIEFSLIGYLIKPSRFSDPINLITEYIIWNNENIYNF